MDEAIKRIEKSNIDLEPEVLDEHAVRELLSRYARAKKLVSYGETMLAAKLDDPEIVARTTGVSVGKAKASVDTGNSLKGADQVREAFKSGELSLDQASEISKALESHADRRIVVGMRPEDIEDAALAPDSPKDRRMVVTVELREAMGAEVYAHFQVDAAPVVTEETKEIAADAGEEALGLLEAQAGENKTVFVARLGARTEAVVGRRIEVAIDTRNLHFFDPETGEGIY